MEMGEEWKGLMMWSWGGGFGWEFPGARAERQGAEPDCCLGMLSSVFIEFFYRGNMWWEREQGREMDRQTQRDKRREASSLRT